MPKRRAWDLFEYDPKPSDVENEVIGVEEGEVVTFECPRCHVEDTDETTILDHGMCRACLEKWKYDQLDEREISRKNDLDEAMRRDSN